MSYGLAAYSETPYASLPVALDGVSLSAAQELPAFDQSATLAAIVALAASSELPAFDQTSMAAAVAALQSNVELPPFDQIATIGQIALIQAAQELPPFDQVATISWYADLITLPHGLSRRITSANDLSGITNITSPHTTLTQVTAA